MSGMMKGAPFNSYIIPIRLGMSTDQLTGYAGNGGPPDDTQNQSAGQRVQTDPMAPSQNQQTGQPVRDESVAPNQKQSAGRRVRTEPVGSSPAQSRYLGVNSSRGSFPFFPGRAIFRGRCPRLLDDGANLTSRRSVDRTSAWNPIARPVRSRSL